MSRAGAGAKGDPPLAARPADAARAQQAFLSHLRHELRTPVNAVIGYSEMLLEDEGDGPRRGDLEKIHGSGRTLLGLIDQLLDPARLQGSLDAAQLEAVGARVRHELRTPVNTVVGYAEMLLEDEAELPPAAADDLRRIRDAGRKLLAFVEDILSLSRTGPGGLGGAFESSGVASVIRDVVTTIKPLEADAARRSEGGRLLVVDDNEVNRDMLCRRLRREGYAAEEAEDGVRALERLERESFDLVLLDILMPGLNGYQVLERLKADPRLRHIPVIMISALDEIDSVVRCIEIGAEDYLAKPFDPVILRARLGACLEKKRLRDREVTHLRRIEEEKQRADELLHVILPHEIVEELKNTNAVRPRRHEQVAVLFCDIVGFTPFCANRQPDEIVRYLQDLIVAYEEVALRHQVLKIKTIGDSFMGACGLTQAVDNPALHAVRCGLEMLETVRGMPAGWEVRVGVHVGPVTAGVVGHRTYLFDLWGDTVNTAARVESHGRNGAVNVSPEVWALVHDRCRGASLGVVRLKGKGEMEIYRVDGLLD